MSTSTSGIGRAFRLHPLATFFACGLGSGLSPIAPGTAGSAAAVGLAWLLARWLGPPHGTSIRAGVGLLASGLAIAAAGIPASTRAARAIGAKDPGCIVVDEFAGQFLASAPVPFFRFASSESAAAVWIASFLLFRLFDVWKPGLVNRVQDLPDGLGIVLDDVLAGLLAAGGTLVLAAWILTKPWF